MTRRALILLVDSSQHLSSTRINADRLDSSRPSPYVDPSVMDCARNGISATTNIITCFRHRVTMANCTRCC